MSAQKRGPDSDAPVFTLRTNRDEILNAALAAVLAELEL